MRNFQKLTRTEMKNVTGGLLPPSKCQCTLTSSTGQSLTMTIGGNATDPDSCTTACKNACANANEIGGNCDKNSGAMS